jgi:hypothetical protein
MSERNRIRLATLLEVTIGSGFFIGSVWLLVKVVHWFVGLFL